MTPSKNARVRYNEVLDMLFKGVIGSSFKTPTPGDYNRVRKLCKLYSPECVENAIQRLESRYVTHTNPKFMKINDMINYLTRITEVLFDKSGTSGLESALDAIDTEWRSVGRKL